jgi:uncharacterized protein YbaR (Trm112 family)
MRIGCYGLLRRRKKSTGAVSIAPMMNTKGLSVNALCVKYCENTGKKQDIMMSKVTCPTCKATVNTHLYHEGCVLHCPYCKGFIKKLSLQPKKVERSKKV